MAVPNLGISEKQTTIHYLSATVHLKMSNTTETSQENSSLQSSSESESNQVISDSSQQVQSIETNQDNATDRVNELTSQLTETMKLSEATQQ